MLMIELGVVCFGTNKRMVEIWKTQKWRMIMSNSFFGLDKPGLLPPNITFTGPLIDTDDNGIMERLQEKDPELYTWLEDAAEKGEKVFYLTIGSECLW